MPFLLLVLWMFDIITFKWLLIFGTIALALEIASTLIVFNFCWSALFMFVSLFGF
jgi:hypothetical protein